LNSISSRITQQQESCSDSPKCQTAIIDLSSPSILTFTFTITSDAAPEYNTITTFDYKYNVTCGAEIQTITE